MNDLLHNAIAGVFVYPSSPHWRRHGPSGYLDYGSYKPWLRDEFHFRCVYCLTRERWRPDGHEGFSADHFNPQSTQPAQQNDYKNLFYVCCSCNAARGALPLPLNPTNDSLDEHLTVMRDGTIESQTSAGAQIIAIYHLNRPRLVDFRQRLLRLLSTLSASDSQQAKTALIDLLAFPIDLPDLKSKRPPGGNEYPDAVAQSHFEQRLRGELPEVY